MSKFKFIKTLGVLVLGSLLTACLPQPTKETGITITTPSPLSLKVGASHELTYEIVNPDNLALTWTSSLPEVVSVSNLGKVEALSEGSATVTATLGEKTATINIFSYVGDDATAVYITTPSPLSLKVGETFDIAYETVNPENLQLHWTSSMPSTVSVTNTGKVEALKAGNVQITATLGSKTANIMVEATAEISGGLNLQASKSEITLDEYAIFTTTGQSGSANNVKYVITEGANFGAISGKNLLPNKKGTVKVVAQNGALTSNEVEITIKDSEKQTTNPYKGMTKTEFYDQYEPATSLQDAIYRSDSNFMSGSIAEQDEAPTIAANQPKENGLFVRNQTINYANNKQIYYITDTEGNIKNAVYKGGAYVILEEVAAYLFAFGDIPANYTSSKSMKPSNSPWREYLRLNHTYFSGDTSQYPYEPVLPNISGVFSRGDRYYELDIGTTGTDTGDPKYEVTDYNNGTKIVRGAARIVYTYEKDNGDKFDDPNEKHLFYTYNHYNDFQEYLNYEGGWGEMFGNITGGGELSSKINYKPTPYVETSYAYF